MPPCDCCVHLAAPLTCNPQLLPASNHGCTASAGFRHSLACLPSCRLWQGAYYNLNNCESLVSCAAELQVSCRMGPRHLSAMGHSVWQVQACSAVHSCQQLDLVMVSTLAQAGLICTALLAGTDTLQRSPVRQGLPV